MTEIDGTTAEGQDVPVQPGALSALLADLAASPDTELDAGWAPRLPPGARIGRFEIVRELGRGGFGVVYEARDGELGRLVAFKTVRLGPHLGPREKQLLREAETAARLCHPNIVTLFDAGRCEHGPYLVLELLRGRTLSERLAAGAPSVDEAVRIATEVSRGLAHAHEHGVVHRDLKPGNVFLCEGGGVKVLDLGLAHAFGRRIEAGGTPDFMAPEQRRGAPEDERSDVFALGALIHLMVTGRPPSARNGDGGGPPRPRAAPDRRTARALAVPEAPELGPLVARMLAEDPCARPRDAGEVLAALEPIARSLERAGDGGPYLLPPTGPRRPSRGAAILAAGLLLGAGGTWVAARFLDPTPGGRRTGGASPSGAGPVRIAVADVENDTGQPDLDALSGLLITSLEQSHQLQVLTRARLLDLARQGGHATGDRLDATLGRHLARGAGAQVFLVPAARRLGDLFVVEVRALDPASGRSLFTVSDRGPGKSAVPGLVDQVSEMARVALQEDRAAVESCHVRVGEVVTSNLEAYRHYFLGQAYAAVEFQGDRALAEFREALRADPGFVLPRLQIAMLAAWHEVPGEDPDAHLAEAAAHADRLPEKERRILPLLQSYSSRRFDDARPALRELLDAYPMDKEVLYLSGEALWHGGSASGPAEAASLFRRALDLDPGYLTALIHLMQWLGRFGPADEALLRSRRATEMVHGPMAQAMLARAMAYGGDLDGGVAEARRAASGSGGRHFEVSYALAELLLVTGEQEAAEAELRRWLSPAAAPGDRRIAGEFLPILLAAQGRRGEAMRAWKDLTELDVGADGRYHEAVLRVHVALAGGDARAALQALREWSPGETAAADAQAWLWTWLGDPTEGAARAGRLVSGSRWERRHAAADALRRGRPDVAAAILLEVVRQDPALEPLFMLGQALAGSGRHEEAAAAFDTVSRAYPLYAPMWQASLQPWSLYLSARSLEQLGRGEEARRRLDRLLAQWRRADPDLPLLADARTLRARLGQSAAR